MRIIFVRHGEPNYEKDCLTPLGLRQAQACAERLRGEGIAEVFSSPFGRARETAAATARVLGLPVRILDFMHELHWGSADGSPVLAGGHPWSIADELASQGWDLTNPAWREHPFFANNIVTPEVDLVEQGMDQWLLEKGYRREGAFYRCIRPEDAPLTVSLFSHGGSSAAAIAHILNLPFPYVIALMHFAFTGITVLRLDSHPGVRFAPVLELCNDAAHLRGLSDLGPGFLQ